MAYFFYRNSMHEKEFLVDQKVFFKKLIRTPEMRYEYIEVEGFIEEIKLPQIKVVVTKSSNTKYIDIGSNALTLSDSIFIAKENN